jgi:predicted dehydrogenase
MERAARAGKPVFCLPSLEDDSDNADALARRVHDARLPVLMAAAAGFTPAALRLAEFRRERLGPARLLVCEAVHGEVGALDSGTFAWLLSLLGAEPTTVTGAGSASAGLTSVTVEAAGGQALQLTHWHASGARAGLRLHLAAERGQILLEHPRRLSWAGADGAQVLTLPRTRPVEQVMLSCFHRLATGGQPTWPGLGDAHRALICLRAAELSRAEGRTVAL